VARLNRGLGFELTQIIATVVDVRNQEALYAEYVDLSTDVPTACGVDRKRHLLVTDAIVRCNLQALTLARLEVRSCSTPPDDPLIHEERLRFDFFCTNTPFLCRS